MRGVLVGHLVRRGWRETEKWEHTSSTHSINNRSWSSTLNLRALTTSGLKVRIMIGFSGALVHTIQSLRGSSCARMRRMFSRHCSRISGLDCSRLMHSLAVTASMAGSAAEKV